MKEEPVSIVIPVYNEKKAIAQTIEEIKQAMKNLDYELIVVDDCSSDGSYEILNEIKGIKLIRHKINKGYGASLKTGIKASKNKWILMTDGDGTYPNKDIPTFLGYRDGYDLITGARIGKIVKIPLVRRPAKWFLTRIASYIADRRIIDLNSGMRLFKKDLAMQFWNLYPERFSFTSTSTMAFLTSNYNVKFVPINYYKRKGKSTMHPIKDFIEFNKLLLKLCLFFRPLKIFIPLSIVIFLIGLGALLVGLFKFNLFFDQTFIMITIASIQVFIFGLIAELIVKTRK